MKKTSKKEVIIAFIVGIILSSSVAVYATNYLAKDISYTKTGTETPISVEQALNELYQNKKNVETGRIDIDFSRSWQYQTITYAKEYKSIPKIFYTYAAGSSGGSVFVTNITKTSFDIGYRSFYNTLYSDTVKWIAIEE